MDELPIDFEIISSQQRRPVRREGLYPGLLALLAQPLFAFLADSLPELAVLGRGLAYVGIGLLAIQAIKRIPRTCGEGSLRFDPASATLTLRAAKNSPVTLSSAELTRGRIVPPFARSVKPEWQVDLWAQAGERLRLRLGTEAEARRLLAALGLGAAHRRLELGREANGALSVSVLGAYFLTAPLGGLALTTGMRLDSWSPAALYVIGFVACVRWLLRVTRPGAVIVGADGVRVTGKGGGFVPMAAIRSARFVGSRLILDRSDGQIANFELGPLEAGLLLQRIEDAREALPDVDPKSTTQALDRKQRSLAEWRAALAALMAQEPGYRAAALSVEDITAVLLDPSAPVERRLAAGLALLDAQIPGSKEQAERVLEASADEALRAPLRAILAGDYESLEGRGVDASQG